MLEWITDVYNQGLVLLGSLGINLSVLLYALCNWIKKKVNEEKVLQKIAKKVYDTALPEIEKHINERADKVKAEIEEIVDINLNIKKEELEEATSKIDNLLDKLPEYNPEDEKSNNVEDIIE